MAIDIHADRHLFANPVGLCWCITGPVGPLGSINQNWLCARLLSMTILIYPVVCVHSCHLPGTQHHCLWPNRRGPAFILSICPLLPTHPPTHPLPYKQQPRYYSGCKKTISKASSEYCTAELAMKH